MKMRVPQLDGLRGIAVLMVVVCHYVGMQFPETLVGSIAIYGFTGVDLFFVLSGFLIGGILLDNRNAENYYRVFYARRILRILPVFLICATAVRVLSHSALQFPLLAHLTISQDYYAAFAILHKLDNESTPLIFGAVWSLAVEEKFYLVIAPAIRLYSRHLKAIVITVVCLSPIIRAAEYLQGGYIYSRFLAFGRFDSLLLGVAVAWFLRSADAARIREIARSARPAAVILIVTAIWTFLSEFTYSVFAYSMLAGFFACIILDISTSPDRWKWLTFAPLRWLGVLSYMIYLIHSPIWYFVGLWTDSYWPHLVASCVLTITIASTSWFMLEARLIRLGQSVRYMHAGVSKLKLVDGAA